MVGITYNDPRLALARVAELDARAIEEPGCVVASIFPRELSLLSFGKTLGS